MKQKILVSGGAGYVGSVLVPKLVKLGYIVRVFDTFWFWRSKDEFLEKLGLVGLTNIELMQGDLRNFDNCKKAVRDIDVVIQLACISNDPSSDLDPNFTHSINYDGNINIIDASIEAYVKRFIYASSSSVYGIKTEPDVTEDMELKPLTQYSKLKVEIEHYLFHKFNDNFKGVIIRPSTVCGYSPRQRLDVVVNILTNFAINKRKIKVFGGEQLRPNIHIEDMADLYVKLVEENIDKINKKVFNAGWDNMKVIDIANEVKNIIGNIGIEIAKTDDNRSYHVSSEKMRKELAFIPKKTVKDAIIDLKNAFEQGQILEYDDIKHYNVQLMKKILGV